MGLRFLLKLLSCAKLDHVPESEWGSESDSEFSSITVSSSGPETGSSSESGSHSHSRSYSHDWDVNVPRCAPCRAFTSFSSYPPTPQLEREWASLADLAARAQLDCDLCWFCWKYINAQDLSVSNGGIRLFREYLPFETPTYRPVQFRLKVADADLSWPLRVDTFPLKWNSRNRCAWYARKLFSECNSAHEKCRNPLYTGDIINNHANVIPWDVLPRRLLDLDHGDEILVVDVKAWHSSGRATMSEISHYCTLSYQWGTTVHASILETSPSNHDIMKLASMPQTFKDAIHIARELDMRFLWIDALCIVQPSAHGDYEDWNEEGPRMGLIYSNASFTIAATCAASAADGFLSIVDDKRLRGASCRVFQYTKDGEAKPEFLNLQHISFDGVVTASSLNRRGWVTQERLLSRRVVHFTVQGIILECSDTNLYEQQPPICVLQHGRTLEVVRGPLFERDFDESYWIDFITYYSKTEFTDPNDRLIALSSLARLHHQQRSHDDHYCAGLWKNSLVTSLMWYRTEPPTPTTSGRLGIAPTWSWASVMGGVQYCKPDRDFSHGIVRILEILDFHSVPVQGNNPYGNVDHGSIKARAQRLILTLPTSSCFNRTAKSGIWGVSPVVREVFWDENQDQSNSQRDYIVIPCAIVVRDFSATVKTSHAALIVEPAHILEGSSESKGDINAYRRIGLVLDHAYVPDMGKRQAANLEYNWGRPIQEKETFVLV